SHGQYLHRRSVHSCAQDLGERHHHDGGGQWEPRALPAMADPPPVRSLAKSTAGRPTAPATSTSWTQAAATGFAAFLQTASLRQWRAMEPWRRRHRLYRRWGAGHLRVVVRPVECGPRWRGRIIHRWTG